MTIEPQMNQTDNQPEHLPEFEGSWERKGRSLNAAAWVGLLGIGVLYVNAQVLIFWLGFLITKMVTTAPEISGTFAERLTASAKIFSPSIRVALVVSQYLFMLVPTLLLIKIWHTKNVRQYIRFRYDSGLEIVLAVLATLAIIPTGAYIGNELLRWFKVPDIFSGFYNELFSAQSFPEFIWLVFIIAITPAICEEVLFRGYVQRTFERTIKAKSVILVGIVFGLYHTQPLSLITLSILGIIFGFCFYWSKSLLPSMAGHFTNNFLAIYLYYKQPEIGGVDLLTADQIPISWVLITLPIAIFILYLYYIITSAKNNRGVTAVSR